MVDDNTTNDAQAHQQPPEPNPDLKGLDRLVGTWEISGGAEERVTYEWMEGGFFLIQRVDLEQYGQKIKGSNNTYNSLLHYPRALPAFQYLSQKPESIPFRGSHFYVVGS
jgi:hypothetical protein